VTAAALSHLPYMVKHKQIDCLFTVPVVGHCSLLWPCDGNERYTATRK